jgi:hypothetical protein
VLTGVVHALRVGAPVQLALLPATYAWIGIGVVVCLLPDLLAVLYALRHFNRLHYDTARTQAHTHEADCDVNA